MVSTFFRSLVDFDRTLVLDSRISLRVSAFKGYEDTYERRGWTVLSRDWRCLNDKCGHVYHSFEKGNPPCPSCGCVRVGWVPGGGHVMAIAPRMDKRLRGIAEQHGLTNLNSASPSRLNRAAPRIETPPLSPELGEKHWGMGITSQFSRHGPVCVEASSPINLRGKLNVGDSAQRYSASTSIPGPEANSILAGRTMQRTVK